MPTKVAIGCVWAVGLILLLAVAGAVYVYQTDQMAELQTSIDQLTTPNEDVGKYGPRSEYMIDDDE